MYSGTFWDYATYVGTIGLFLTLLFLFIRFLPIISIFEMRTLLPQAEVRDGQGDGAPAVAPAGEAHA
jgi:molybdopterin-containing oxidoreductase family membrane subunit